MVKEGVEMGCDDFMSVIRLGVLVRVVRAFWKKELPETIDEIPISMHPRGGRPILCCVSRDREVLRARCLGVLGFTQDEFPDERVPLSEAARQALARDTTTEPFLMVCDVACTSCIRSRYEITNACRNCIVRSCITECPRSAVEVVADRRAEINPDKCINCGKCQDVCPFHAIIQIPIPCEDSCPVKAISKNEAGMVTIDWDLCIYCCRCMQACPFGAILDKSEIIDVLQALQGDRPVVAMLAPAVAGQFFGGIPEIRRQMINLGFHDVVEVALGADAVALEEGREFVERMAQGDRFMTTSCCPVSMLLVEKHLPQLKPFVSHTRSPMRVVAEMVKDSCPGAVTVFVGPCIAKRKEALESGEVDYVLTFEELGAMFDARGLEDQPTKEPGLPGQEAALEGRQFASSGGVTKAIQTLVGDEITVMPVMVDGIDKKAIALLKGYAKKKCPGNFVELMACTGGCVAGPGVIVRPSIAVKELKELLKTSRSLK